MRSLKFPQTPSCFIQIWPVFITRLLHATGPAQSLRSGSAGPARSGGRCPCRGAPWRTRRPRSRRRPRVRWVLRLGDDRDIHGIFIGYSWGFYGNFIRFYDMLMGFYDMLMGSCWFADGMFVISWWHVRDILMGCSWYQDMSTMECKWYMIHDIQWQFMDNEWQVNGIRTEFGGHSHMHDSQHQKL